MPTRFSEEVEESRTVGRIRCRSRRSLRLCHPPTARFAKSSTHLELDRYFIGHTRSWGVFEDTHGAPRRYFSCENHGVRNAAGELVLTQALSF